MSMLDGVSESHDKVGRILVTDELEHLWKLGVFIWLWSQFPEAVPHKVLYDQNHAFATPMHPAFVVNSEAAKYNHSMSIVAMAIDARVWVMMIEGTLDDESHRKLFFQVQKDVMNKAFQTTVIDTSATAADDDETAAQAPKKAHAINLMSMLDGMLESHDKVGGILVMDELEHLWELGVFIWLWSQFSEAVPHKVLYYQNHASATPMHPAFVVNSEAAKYNHGACP
jgi:hypothetical protein